MHSIPRRRHREHCGACLSHFRFALAQGLHAFSIVASALRGVVSIRCGGTENRMSDSQSHRDGRETTLSSGRVYHSIS